MKVLGLDIGRIRTGVAVGDDALAVAVARRSVDAQDEGALLATIAMERIGLLVVGLPRLLSGVEGEEATRIRTVAGRLSGLASVPIAFIDERMTSKAAARSGAYDQDAEAARLILQTYFDQGTH